MPRRPTLPIQRTLVFLIFVATATPSLALMQLRAEVETGSEKFSPSVIVAEGTWNEIETDTLKLRMRVTKTPDAKAAQVQAELSRNEGGETKLLGKPGIIARWDQVAEVSSREEDGTLLYRLRITPSQIPTPPAERGGATSSK